jgi:tRNA nucleotidyltransferase/poly(A) polymerase
MLALNELPSLCSLDSVLGTLHHDVGKGFVTRIEDDDKVHFYEHESVGKEITISILKRLKCDATTIDNVAWLVANHMRMYDFEDMRKAKKIRLITDSRFGDLLNVFKADVRGRHLSANFEQIIKARDRVQNVLDFIEAYKGEKKRSPIPEVRLITGFDLIQLGVKPGPVFAEILTSVEDEILEGKIRTKEKALEEAVKQISLLEQL